MQVVTSPQLSTLTAATNLNPRRFAPVVGRIQRQFPSESSISEYEILTVMSFVRIFRIAIAIALFTHLASTSRAANSHCGGSEESDCVPILRAQTTSHPFDQPRQSVPKLFGSFMAYVKPTGTTGLTRQQCENYDKYKSEDEHSLVKRLIKIQEILAKSDLNKMTREERQKMMKKRAFVKLSVELIVVGRFLVSKGERIFHEKEFIEPLWALVSFIDIMTASPRAPATEPVPENEPAPENAKDVEFVEYLEQNLDVFEAALSLAFQERENVYHDAHVGDSEPTLLDDLIEHRKELSNELYYRSGLNLWTWEKVDYIHQLICLTNLWVNSYSHGSEKVRSTVYAKESMKKVADLITDISNFRRSCIPHGGFGGYVRRYLKEAKDWLENPSSHQWPPTNGAALPA